MRKRLLKIGIYFFSIIALFIIGLLIYVAIVAQVDLPKPENLESLQWERKQLDSGLFVLKNNWLRKSESGLYEMYIEGNPFERGVAVGKLTKELAQYQEEVFVKQIQQIVPSNLKLNLLKVFVGWFNRNLEPSIPEEYKLEIYGVSTEASPDFDYIAKPYQRLLNYHAAHDIGHALQNMSLVGCTSFAAWGNRTSDSSLLIGRNFDFYVGDDFAKNKIIAFYNPTEGHKFMMVTFSGMKGVLSGMNDQGLTVTLNAAKSDIPSSSAMPVSLVAREILQYSSTIEEAFAIAAKRKMFVAESFLIGSAKDGRAAVIEKTPDAIELYDPNNNQIICTNHFQSKILGNTPLNQEHIRTSASMYRWKRVEEILSNTKKVSVENAADLLRDQKGIAGTDLGLGNEKAINQLIAHHAVIFQPNELKVWISTAPWQLGKFVCYDLNKIFALSLKENHEIYDSTLMLTSDPFFFTKQFEDFNKFAKYRFPFQPRDGMQPDSLVKWNPRSYLSYMLAGDACFSKKDFLAASSYYEKGLVMEIASEQERSYMKAQVNKCKDKLK
jgi:isopenicillin-N N-acyltransferase like protein